MSEECDNVCTECKFHEHTITNCMWGDGWDKKPTIMFVMDFPDYPSDKFNKVLGGDTKHLMGYLFEKSGIDKLPDRFYYTYALKCRVPYKKKPAKRDINACRENLLQEIKQVKPQLIVPMGQYAWQMLSDYTSIKEFRGHFDTFTMAFEEGFKDKIRERKLSIPMLPTWSLQSALGKWEYINYLIHDFKKINKFVTTGKIDKTPLCKHTLCLTKKDLNAAYKRYTTAEVITTDFETTGLSFHKDEIINVGYCDGKHADIIFLREYTKDELENKKWGVKDKKLALRINRFVSKNKKYIKKIVRAINASPVKKIGQNLKFDIKFARKNKIPYKNWYFDTIIAEALIDENNFKSLNDCLERNGINFGPYDTKLWPYINKDAKKQKPYSYAPPMLLTRYLAMDVYGDFLLYKKQVKQLKKEDMWDLMFKQQMPLGHLLVDAEYRGFKCDKEMMLKFSDIVAYRLARVLKRIRKYVKDDDFNPASGDQLAIYMENAGYPFEKFKIKKGAKDLYSVAKDTLAKFKRVKKWAKLPNMILEYRALNKMKSTYIDGADGDGGLLALLDRNSYIHTSYNIHGPRTGRLSSSGPNCLSLDTEILTTKGWRNYKTIQKDDKTISLDCDKGKLVKQGINKIYISNTRKHSMYSGKNTQFDYLVTHNHRNIYKDRKNDKISVRFAENPILDAKMLHGGLLKQGKKLDVNYIKLLVAIQADAHRNDSGKTDSLKYRISVTKDRKVNRLRGILDALQVDYTYTETKNNHKNFTIRIPKSYISKYLNPETKAFTYAFLNLSEANRTLFINELSYWDGLYTRKDKYIEYYSNDMQNIDVIQAVASTVGYRSKFRNYVNSTGGQCFILSIIRRDYSLTATIQHKKHSYTGRVWCVNVDVGTIITRRNNKVLVTGNSQNFPRPIQGLNIRNFFIPPKDYVVWEADFGQLELRIIAYLAGDTTMIDEFKSGVDLHTRNTLMFNKTLKYFKNIPESKFVKFKDFKKPINYDELDKAVRDIVDKKIKRAKKYDGIRFMAKKIAFGSNYGIEAETLADEFDVPIADVETMFEYYFEKYHIIAEYREKIKETAVEKGILSLPLTGRKRRFTSLTNFLNSEYGESLYGNKRNSLIAKIERQAMNFPVQGLANEIYTRSKLKLFEDIKKQKIRAFLGFSIHDGMVNYAHINDVKKIGALVDKHFNMSIGKGKKRIPLTSDFEVFTRWKGEKIYLDDFDVWAKRIKDPNYKDIDINSLKKD